MEVIEDEEDLTSQKLIALEKKYKPGRIIIEFNGMWMLKDVKFPWHWKVEQQITMINGKTFANYFTNMKSLVAEQIRGSELIIMNRCDGMEDKIAAIKIKGSFALVLTTWNSAEMFLLFPQLTSTRTRQEKFPA